MDGDKKLLSPQREGGPLTDLTLAFAGDILPTRPLASVPSAETVYGLIRDADLGIGNFEIPLTESGAPLHKLLNIRADPAVAPSVPSLGFQVLTIANNHAVDYGWSGLVETRTHLEAAGITVVGAGENLDAAARPAILNVNGWRVGIIAFSSLTPTGLTASARRPGIAPIHVETGYEIDPWYQMEEPGDPSVVRIRTRARSEDVAYATAAIARLRPLCDALVVTIHWGFGSGEDLAEYQRPLAETLIDAGADVVHGHHPHAIHAIGFYRSRPILFSAGTFVGQQIFLEASAQVHALWAGMSPDGYVAQLRLRRDEAPDLIVHPITMDQERLPRLAEGAVFERIAERLARLSGAEGGSVIRDGQTLRLVPTVPSHTSPTQHSLTHGG